RRSDDRGLGMAGIQLQPGVFQTSRIRHYTLPIVLSELIEGLRRVRLIAVFSLRLAQVIQSVVGKLGHSPRYQLHPLDRCEIVVALIGLVTLDKGLAIIERLYLVALKRQKLGKGESSRYLFNAWSGRGQHTPSNCKPGDGDAEAAYHRIRAAPSP